MSMLANPTFFFLTFMNSISLGMNMFIIAAGLSLILGVLRVINFAHGAFFMFGAYVCYSTVTYLDEALGAFWLGVVAAGIVLAAMAVVVERGFLHYLYEREHLTQLLFTFAVVLIVGDLAKMIWGTDQYNVPYPHGLDGAVNFGFTIYPAYPLVLIGIGLTVAVGMWLALSRTRWGRIIRAATQDREMLAALGMNVPMVYTGVFVIGSALAGIGGALAAPRVAVSPGMDATIIIECFIIVIIGGLGSLWGSFLGALAYGFVNNFGLAIVPEWELVLAYVMMLGILLWRPWGLFGQPEEDSH
ncbi:MAG: branched-chain amino acid ABC transporter permease [Alphaproteobacteria bacterium]|nr:branched-chain amino acid ABC transporter permease [Rhodospirillaceae bacterium]MDP6405202.1 branched-chain amino acid ABC transporter permease [Alphaproteobacteria bacterium]MDP6623103.1 branched-chain amino acid ABC transporter permease [Alphaproteobacteria bacterium]